MTEKISLTFLIKYFNHPWFVFILILVWEYLELLLIFQFNFKACAHKYVHYYNFTNRDEHASYGACYRFSNDFMQEYKVIISRI